MLRSLPLILSLGEQTNPYLATAFFQEVTQRDKIPPEHPFVLIKKNNLPHPCETCTPEPSPIFLIFFEHD